MLRNLSVSPLLVSSTNVVARLFVSAPCHSGRDFDATFLEMVLSVLTGCAEVNQLVEKGVLIIISKSSSE